MIVAESTPGRSAQGRRHPLAGQSDSCHCGRDTRRSARCPAHRAAVVRHVDRGLQGQPEGQCQSARVHPADLRSSAACRYRQCGLEVKAWLARLREDDLAQSYIYALYRRLSQIMDDAVHDGVLGRNPCSRRTSPPMGKAKLYVATTEQVWAIYDAMPDHLRSRFCSARSVV